MDGCFRIFSRYELNWGILNLRVFIYVLGNIYKLKVVWEYIDIIVNLKYFYVKNL